MNHVILTGRLVKDPEIRYTNDKKAVASFTVACADGKKDGKPRSQFIPCVAWEKTAELVDKYFLKGDPITVTGKITVRTYEKDGRKVYVTEVRVLGVEFPLQKKREQAEERGGPDAFAEVYDDDGELPF